MSRIEEALQRATVGVADPVQDRSGDAGATQRPLEADNSLLDQYPREDRGAADRGEAVRAFAREDSRAAADESSRRQASLRQMPAKSAIVPVAVPAFDGKLVVGADASPLQVEQYRRLAASVHELQLERGLRALAVTSAIPKEGKSLTVANLALTLSESFGRRVLLVDADLRRPCVHTLFGLPNAAGLVDVLRSDRVEPPLLPVTPRLRILTAGVPDGNPVAGITSDRMRALLQEASHAFDWVLLDAPPVAIMPDAALLAGMTRAIILVIAAGSTPYAQVSRAIDELGRDYVIGTVLNRLEDRDIPDTAFYREYQDSGLAT